eukprot:2246510-Prymnesium_polylepis.1
MHAGRAAGTVELVGHICHRVPVIRILRVAHPPAHIRPMCTAAELSLSHGECAAAPPPERCRCR